MNVKNAMQKLEKNSPNYSQNHYRKYLQNTEYFDKNSSQNMKEFYITDKAGNCIEDIDEAINNSIEEIKKLLSVQKVRVLIKRSQPSVSTRREPKKKLRAQK